jgi:hypothetical protein
VVRKGKSGGAKEEAMGHEDADVRRLYLNEVCDFYRVAKVAHGAADSWMLHDRALGLAHRAASALLAEDPNLRSTPDWAMTYGEWLRIAAIHADLARNLKERP